MISNQPADQSKSGRTRNGSASQSTKESTSLENRDDDRGDGITFSRVDRAVRVQHAKRLHEQVLGDNTTTDAAVRWSENRFSKRRSDSRIITKQNDAPVCNKGEHCMVFQRNDQGKIEGWCTHDRP